MNKTYLNFMHLIELFVDQEMSIEESLEEVELAQSQFDEIEKLMQSSELNLQEINSYLQKKASIQSLQRIYEDYISANEKTKLQIMEVLSAFPNLEKIHLNNSKTQPYYLTWDLEEGKFQLFGHAEDTAD